MRSRKKIHYIYTIPYIKLGVFKENALLSNINDQVLDEPLDILSSIR